MMATLERSDCCTATSAGHELFFTAQVGFVYVFNLIVGFGVLTLPKAFSEAGYLFGIILLGWLCFMR